MNIDDQVQVDLNPYSKFDFRFLGTSHNNSADGARGIIVAAQGKPETVCTVPVNTIVAMMLAVHEVCAGVQVDESGGLHIKHDEMTRALQAATVAFGDLMAANEGTEALIQLTGVAVEQINAKAQEFAAQHPTRRDDENTRPPSIAAGDLALARDLGITNDPAHGGPGGGMGDAAAMLPVPGVTRGNELHSKPVMRLHLPPDFKVQ